MGYGLTSRDSSVASLHVQATQSSQYERAGRLFEELRYIDIVSF
jgi:hypothetical protein